MCAMHWPAWQIPKSFLEKYPEVPTANISLQNAVFYYGDGTEA